MKRVDLWLYPGWPSPRRRLRMARNGFSPLGATAFWARYEGARAQRLGPGWRSSGSDFPRTR